MDDLDENFEVTDDEFDEIEEVKPKKKAKPKKAAKPKEVKPEEPAKAAPTKAKNRDEFGLLVGSVRSRAAALYAREEGATLKEVADEVGSIQFNVLTKLQKDGFEVTHTNEAGEKNRTVKRFFLHRK